MPSSEFFLATRDILICLLAIDLVFLMLAIAEEYFLPKWDKPS